MRCSHGRRQLTHEAVNAIPAPLMECYSLWKSKRHSVALTTGSEAGGKRRGGLSNCYGTNSSGVSSESAKRNTLLKTIKADPVQDPP